MRYTKEELLAHTIADLETDVRCAERDGRADYAEDCRRTIAVLRASDPQTVDIDKVLRS